MTELLCQSVVSPVRGPGPCEIFASTVLFGIHLCGNHERYWAPRLERGEKVRIHPQRALPVDHRCVVESRRCTRCGQTKPIFQFGTHRRGERTWPQSWCKRCMANYQREHKRPASGASNKPPAPLLPVEQPVPTLSAAAAESELTVGRDRPDPPAPLRLKEGRYAYFAELECLHCADRIGEVIVATPSSPARMPSSLRCQRCGGPPIQTGEVERRWMGPEPPFTAAEKPKRGRPPKRVVEARRADAERLAS